MTRPNFSSIALCTIALSCSALLSSAQNITTVAGCGIGDDSLASRAELLGPVGVAFDKAGNAYIADAQHYTVRKVNTSGVITTIAGTGLYGYSGDNGPATAAKLGDIYSVAADAAGNVFIVDNGNNAIRKISTSGIITTVAGTGTAGYNGDNIAATTAQLNNPIDIAIDTAGNIIFTDWYNYRLRKINTAGIITTIAGDGATGTTGNHGPATASRLGAPFRVTLDNKGNIYVAEVIFQCVAKIDTAGILTIIADTTGTYALGPDGDGGAAATATMTSPCGLAYDTAGYLYFSDIGNNRVRVIDLNSGTIGNYAATGIPGYSGDGGPASAAQVGTLEGLACDAAGNLYISDADNNRVRLVTKSTGIMSTFAGRNALFGEGYTATDAEISEPSALSTDAAGNVYIADYDNNRVRKLNISTGTITTVAGDGIAGYNFSYSGDGGPATGAHVANPFQAVVDAAGNIYVSDESNSRIRKVSPAGIITTYAGTGTAGYNGDNGPANLAELNYPAGIALDRFGNLYIADESNYRVRMIDTMGIIHTVAGLSSYGFTGDGGPATNAQLYAPISVAVDATGNIYIADVENNDIRKVDTAGIIHSITLNGASGFSGDGDSSIYAQVNGPCALAVDNAGNLFFADLFNQRIRYITAQGIIHSIAGSGTAGFSGDGGAALSADLNYPDGVAVDGLGHLYIADALNNRIRKVSIGYLSAPNVSKAPAAINVYPNPTSAAITVQTGVQLTGSEQMALFNALGQIVYTRPLVMPAETIDMSAMPAGEYILQVTGRNGVLGTVKVTRQ